MKRRHDLTVRWLKREGLWDALVIWCEADAGVMFDSVNSTPAADGQTVTVWVNRRSAAGNMHQTTANRMPTLVAGGLFGAPAVRFNGANALNFDTAGRQAFSGADRVTVIAGFHDLAPTSGSAIHFVYHWHTPESENTQWLTLMTRHPTWTNGAGATRRGFGLAAAAIQFGATVSAPSVTEFIADTVANSTELYLNGILTGSEMLAGTGAFGNGTASIGGLGGTNNGENNTLDGLISGFFVFRTALSETQREYLRNHITRI